LLILLFLSHQTPLMLPLLLLLLLLL